MKTPHITLLFLLNTSVFFVGARDYQIFCYWNTLSYYREGQGKFRAWNIEPNLCTHLAYSFFGLDEHGEIKILDSFVALQMETLRQATAQKKINPNIKVLASIGGKREGSIGFSNMASNKNNRSKFISSVVAFLNKFHLDGIDLDWEYPTLRGGRAEDRSNFILLLRELNKAFKEKQFLLTVAVAGNLRNPSIVYNIPKLAEYADLINLMTYNFNEASYTKLLHNAPLYGTQNGSVALTANYWITRSGNASKILLGIPFFGHTYTLLKSERNSIGSESLGFGLPGKWTHEPGLLGYNEICHHSDWTRIFDSTSKVPYTFKDNQWISYDGVLSVIKKIKYMKFLKMGGAMVWTIDLDDFSGNCGQKYPLLRAIYEKTKKPTFIVSTRPPVKEYFMCEKDGLYPIPMECTRFYKCQNGERDDYECLNGLFFDEKSGRCNLPKFVNCDQNYTLWKPGMKEYNYNDFPINLKVKLHD